MRHFSPNQIDREVSWVIEFISEKNFGLTLLEYSFGTPRVLSLYAKEKDWRWPKVDRQNTTKSISFDTVLYVLLYSIEVNYISNDVYRSIEFPNKSSREKCVRVLIVRWRLWLFMRNAKLLCDQKFRQVMDPARFHCAVGIVFWCRKSVLRD